MVDLPPKLQNTDAVLGGQSPPPRDSATLGGMAGLRQHFVAGNCEQKIEILPTALNYGEAGIEFLIKALNDPELTVKATAYKVLKNADTNPAKQAILDGILLHPGDRVYDVYVSDISYDDDFYYLIDSFEKIEDEYYEYYDAKPQMLGRCLFRETAIAIAEDLHQTIVAGTRLKAFFQRHEYQADFRWGVDLSHLQRLSDYFPEQLYCFDRNWDISLDEWCADNQIDREEDEYDYQFMARLFKQQKYQLLAQLLEILEIGKYAFVREIIIDKETHYTYTRRL
ncbi:hypothetical protein [Lusitaniella coriacea]|uniref:hypothetical protein n=1 Tax=Lusitaniella coriacea TaxID=1983105 RepID=UPI003CF6FA4C